MRALKHVILGVVIGCFFVYFVYDDHDTPRKSHRKDSATCAEQLPWEERNC